MQYVVKEWDVRTKRTLCVIFAAGFMMFCIVTALERHSQTLTKDDLKRPEYGQETVTLPVIIRLDGDEAAIETAVALKPREYSEEQAFAWINKVLEGLEQEILGENESLDCVTQSLNLFQDKEGTPVTLRWYTDNFALVDYEGNIHDEAFAVFDGEKVQIAAVLSCGEYSCEYVNEITVFPQELSEKEKLIKQIQEAIEAAQENDDEYAFLPENVFGHSVKYTKRKSSSAWYILFLAAAAATAVAAGEFQRKREKEIQRKKQLQYDYSEVVSKLTLLMGAGMTVRTAWERMVSDYEKQKKHNQIKKRSKRKTAEEGGRYVYDEMAETLKMMNAGMAEVTAYEKFGQRCDTKEYIKFSMLITQNIKKGTKDLIRLLELETAEAFENRKNLAVKYGEKAGTKLLFPMIIMLIIVMAIIMIPAMMNF